MRIKPIIADEPLAQMPGVRSPLGASSGSARGFGVIGQSLGGVAQDWQGVATEEQKAEKRKKAYDDLFNSATLHQDAGKQIADRESTWNQLEYGDVVPAVEKDLSGIKSSLITKANEQGMSPEAIRAFEKDWIGLSGKTIIGARAIDDNKFKQKTIDGALQLKSMAIDESIPMDQAGRDQLFAGVDQVFNNLTKDGFITAEHGFNHKKDMRLKAEAKTKALIDEIQRQDEKAAETRADMVLSDRFGSDYENTLDALGNPSVYSKELGLTAQQAANLGNIVHNRQIRAKRIQDGAQEEIARNFAVRLRNNELTHEMVKESIRVGSMDYRVGDSFDKAIEAQMKDENGKIKTDPATYSRLLTLAYDNPDKELVKKEILRNVHLLDEADVEKLLGKNEEKGHSILGAARSRGVEFIKNTVIPKRGLMASYLSTPQEEEDLASALRAFDKAIEDIQRIGKPISGDEIKKLAEDASNTHRKTLGERMRDFQAYTIQQMKKEVGKTKESAPSPPTNLPKRNPGESVDAYLKRTGQK